MLVRREHLRFLLWMLPICVLLGVSDGWAQCVTPGNTVATAPGAFLMVCPRGDGPSLGGVGSPVSVNSSAVPCAGMPPIAFEFDGAVPAQICDCVGGIPFVEMPAGSGLYTYPGPISAGGWTTAGTQMKVQGVFVPTIMGFRVNSPDNNADGIINLTDLAAFAAWFTNAVYDFPADMNGDGVENLSDIGIFSVHFGHACTCDPID